MATLPTVPTFASNDSSLTNLQNLSAAVAFLCRADIRPTWHYYIAGGQGTSAATWAVMKAADIAFDSDNLWTSTGYATIVTQGYYQVEACVDVEMGGDTTSCYSSFLFTAGTNNIHKSSGTTIQFGMRGGDCIQTAAQDTSICTSSLVPVCCYPGDTLQVYIMTETNSTINANVNTNYMAGRFTANFTGYMVRTGT